MRLGWLFLVLAACAPSSGGLTAAPSSARASSFPWGHVHLRVVGDDRFLDGGLALGDVDGDGVTDVLAGVPQESTGGDAAGAVYAYAGTRTGEVTASRADALVFGHLDDRYLGFGLAVVDVDRDGVDDLVARAAEHLYAFRGPVRWPTDATAAWLAGDPVQDVAVLGDVDGDGHVDWAFERSDGSAERVSRAASHFGTKGALDADPTAAIGTPAGDVDGDGLADVLVSTSTESRIERGDGTEIAWTSGAALRAIGDVDGDGHADALRLSPDSADGEVLSGPLAGDVSTVAGSAVTFAPSGDTAGSPWVYDARPAGDVDGDGLDDALVFERYTPVYGDSYVGDPEFAVWLLTEGASRAIELSEQADSPMDVVAGDVDGDGLSDLVLGTSYDVSNGRWALGFTVLAD